MGEKGASIGLSSSASLIHIIERKVIPDSIVYSDCWRGYNILDVSDFKHYRINHSKLFSDKKNHINGIENFWNINIDLTEIFRTARLRKGTSLKKNVDSLRGSSPLDCFICQGLERI